MLNLSPEATGVFKTIVARIHEVTSGIIEVISQLLSKLLSWAGVDVDLSKIKIDLDQSGSATSSQGQ